MQAATLILDGGGTCTDIAVVYDGRICARTELSSYKPLRDHNRTDELCRAIGGFLATAKLTPEEADIRFCIVGMSGVWSDNERNAYANALCDAWMQYVDNALPALRVISDVELVHIAAFGDKPGIVLIAGTGSIAVARTTEGNLIRCGGWGPRLDDEGGGFWMGREALRSVACMVDKRGPETLLIRPVAAYLRCDPADSLLLEHRLRTASIDSVARIARAVLTYAEEGDDVAQRIAERGAAALSAIVHPLCAGAVGDSGTKEQTALLPIVLHGSLFSSLDYRTLVERSIRAKLPSAEIDLLDDLIATIAPQLRPRG